MAGYDWATLTSIFWKEPRAAPVYQSHKYAAYKPVSGKWYFRMQLCFRVICYLDKKNERGIFTIAIDVIVFVDLVLLHTERSVCWQVSSNNTKCCVRGTNWFLAYFFGKYGISHYMIILIVSLIIFKNFTNPCIFVSVFAGAGCVHILDIHKECWNTAYLTDIPWILQFSHNTTCFALSIFSQHLDRSVNLCSQSLHGICDINSRIMYVDLHWILK